MGAGSEIDDLIARHRRCDGKRVVNNILGQQRLDAISYVLGSAVTRDCSHVSSECKGEQGIKVLYTNEYPPTAFALPLSFPMTAPRLSELLTFCSESSYQSSS